MIFVVVAGWVLVALAALAVARLVWQESRADRLLVLLYHRVVAPEVYARFSGAERIFSIPADRFREQLEWLVRSGRRVVSLDTLVDALEGRTQLPGGSVCITFDDGCASVHTRARPILQELGLPATVFVTTDENAWIFHEGEYTERRMTPDEIRACAQSGLQIGSHAVTHRGLNEMSPDEVRAELRDSREQLTKWAGTPVDTFSVPLNFYNRTTLALCREAGYRAVCTSDNGATHPGASPLALKRFIVEGSYDLAAFQRSLEPRVMVQRRVLSALKRLPPKLLGERLWMPLRARIFASPLGPWLSFRHLRVGLALLAALLGALLVAGTLAALG